MSFVPYNLRQPPPLFPPSLASASVPRRVAGFYAVFQRVAPADTVLADDDSLGEPEGSRSRFRRFRFADSIESINRGSRYHDYAACCRFSICTG